MLALSVDTSELLKWSRYLQTIPRRTDPAIARALNTVSDNVVKSATAYIAEQTGLDPDDVAEMITVKPATPDDLSVEINMLKINGGDASRPWAGRDGSDSTFEQNTLVKIVTSGDEKVCEKCSEISANSPYTLEEVNDMNPYGTVDPTATEICHPRCRCVIQSWSATRQLPVRFGDASFSGGGAPPELFTMRQLGQAIAGELQVVLKAE